MEDCTRVPPSLRAWRPIHYLGSKLRVIDEISDLIDQVAPHGGRACDLFAGSGTVSAAIARQRPVTAVDIQEYSRVLCSALLNPGDVSQSETVLLLSRAINGEFHRELQWACQPLIQYERYSLDEAEQGRFQAICDLIEAGSVVSYQSTDKLGGSPSLRAALEKTCKRLSSLGLANGPRAVILRHFGGIYFSYTQAIELAALMDVAVEQTGRHRNTLIAATLSTTSEIVNTVGKQFAQPIRPRDSQGRPKAHLIQKIIRERTIITFTVFSRWLEQYCNIPQSEKPHQIVRADYRDALEHHCGDVSVVYADPPYTRDHYSRYYHVLETMCLRDDPQIAATHPSSKGAIGRGVYRVDRHQSPFCIKSQAPEAFARLFQGVRQLEVPLVLSHSPLANSKKPRPRVIETSDLKKIAEKFFNRVELISAGRVSHNKLNKSSLNSEVTHDAEIFLICS